MVCDGVRLHAMVAMKYYSVGASGVISAGKECQGWFIVVFLPYLRNLHHFEHFLLVGFILVGCLCHSAKMLFEDIPH